MAERLFNLPETKGEMKLRGIATGTEKDSFFASKVTKAKKPMNIVKFGVKVDKESTIQLELNGMTRDEVFFYKKSEVKGQKGTTKRIKWDNRQSFNEDGFNLIGMTVGLEQVADENGKLKNDLKTMAEYDACEYIAEQLEDDQSLFVLGNIDFGSYTNKSGEVKRSVKFIPSKLLNAKPVDFEAEDFEKVADFKQKIVFMGINKDETDKNDVKFIIEAKIVKYSTIEDAEFIVRNSKLANTLRKNLKPYTAIDVWGYINNRVDEEVVEEDDGWGEKSSFDKVSRTYIRELIITGADPSSVDKDTYSQSELDEALKAIANSKKAKDDFGGDDSSWGNSKDSSKEEDDDLDGWD